MRLGRGTVTRTGRVGREALLRGPQLVVHGRQGVLVPLGEGRLERGRDPFGTRPLGGGLIELLLEAREELEVLFPLGILRLLDALLDVAFEPDLEVRDGLGEFLLDLGIVRLTPLG